MEKGYLNVKITFDYIDDEETHSNTQVEAENIQREDTALALAELVNQLSLRFNNTSAFKMEFISALISNE